MWKREGEAVLVPASKVHDARLILAAVGLPRGGGVGFEIFDKGDLGISDFTQKVNFRRATEGELARTIASLAAIKSARVHITMAEKGLYRDDDKDASAAVVLGLQPGRKLSDTEIQGIRHLVSSAVSGLKSDDVTLVDGRGGVLAGRGSDSEKAATAKRGLERDLERRVTALLEAVVGPGAVVAKVTADFDSARVDIVADAIDPESATARSERLTSEASSKSKGRPGGGGGGRR